MFFWEHVNVRVMWSLANLEKGKVRMITLRELSFGLMYHGITYADEAYSKETEGKMTYVFGILMIKRGVIEFPRPEECVLQKTVREMDMKSFGHETKNFSGLGEFEAVK